MAKPRDPALDALLELDGVTVVIDEVGGHWVRFVVTRVPPTSARPHGLDYSLTLHGANGERLVGFDNAHSVRGVSGQRDHRHRLRSVRPYDYRDAASLLEDFRAQVDSVLRKRGAIE